ncbi:MAG: Ig-like domain-containing protein [Leptospirales bacterium]|jgi:hypothetical protein
MKIFVMILLSLLIFGPACSGNRSEDSGDSLTALLLAAGSRQRFAPENPAPTIEGSGELPDALSAFTPALRLHNAIDAHSLTPLAGNFAFSRNAAPFVPMSATFSANIDAGQPHDMTVSVVGTGAELPGIAQISGGNTFTFQPNAAMQTATDYQVDIEATLVDGVTGTVRWIFQSSQTRGTPGPAFTEVRFRCEAGADPAALCALQIYPGTALTGILNGKDWDYHLFIFDLFQPPGSIPDKVWTVIVEGFAGVDLTGAPAAILFQMQRNKFEFIAPNVEMAVAPLNPILTPSLFYMVDAGADGFHFDQLLMEDVYIIYEEYP